MTISNYSLHTEMKNVLSKRWLILCLLIMLVPFLYFLVIKNNYEFKSSYDVFTFLCSNYIPLFFPILAVLVYSVSFSREIKHRYIVYERIRVPIIKLLRVKFFTNVVITFCAFFIFIYGYFIFAYYIEPALGLVNYNQTFFSLNNTTLEAYTYQQNTFSQLTKYGDFVFGIVYACWVALNAAAFASFAFLLLLVVEKTFLALSIPILLYLLQSFIAGSLGMVKYQFIQSIFPFDYVQQPIWTSFVPLSLLLGVCIVLSVYIYFNRNRLEQVI